MRQFVKMQGAGNDYIYMDCLRRPLERPERWARRLSDRHFGVGGDGLICICPARQGDFRMEMYNADGSRGAMCGNGIRCVGKFLYDRGYTKKTELTIETDAGLRQLTLHTEGGTVRAVTVDMGVPIFQEDLSCAVGQTVWRGTPVKLGNPHFVLQVADADAAPVAQAGPELERHTAFPDRTNVEFVQVLGQDQLKMRVWERGSGETLSCGTGACCAAAAMARLGLADSAVTVRMPGGALLVERREDGTVRLTGDAVTVFEGRISNYE